jgi:hypothetical protein
VLNDIINKAFSGTTLPYNPYPNPYPPIGVEMKNRPDLKFRKIHAEVRRHFDFLFKRGFSIVSATTDNECLGNWQIIMMAGECLIKIYCNRGKINLALSTLQLYNEIGLFDLDGLIFYANGGEESFTRLEVVAMDERQQFDRLTGLLKKYIDDILTLFEKISSQRDKDLFTLSSRNGQLFSDNCPFFLLFYIRYSNYSFTSPSITSPSLDEGVEGPPWASG